MMASRGLGSSRSAYILLKDVQAVKQPSAFKKMIGLREFSVVNVHRSELLIQIPENERQQCGDGPLLNYRLFKDPNILLYSGEENVSPLGEHDFKFLVAITSTNDRFTVFSHPEKLDWGASLRKGSRVFVKIPNTQIVASAVIRCKGSIEGLPGIHFGVEITDPRCRGQGSTSGVFRGIEYFQCDVNCGLFVSLDRLSAELFVKSSSEQSYAGAVAAARTARTDPHPIETRQKAKEQRKIEAPFFEKCIFRIGDRVKVHDKQGKVVPGKVVWAGRNPGARELDCIYVGIETATQVRYTEVIGAHPGLTHVTNAPKGHFLAVPQSLVEKYAEPTKLPPPQVKTFEANQDSIDTENTKARAAEIGESYMRFMAERESSTKLESLPPNPDDLPRPVVNRMELEMMHTNTCDTYSTHSSPYMPSFQDAHSVYDQRPSGPQLAWPHGSPSTQLRGGQERSRYKTRSPLPVNPKPVAQYGVRRYPLKPVLEKDHSYESEAVFIEEYEKAYGAAVGEQYIKYSTPTAARDSGSVSTDQNTDASTSASLDYVNDQHLSTNTDPDYIKHSDLPKMADSNQELSKQLKTANQELIEMTGSIRNISEQLSRASQELTEVKDSNQQLTHTNLEQTKTIQLLSQQLGSANAKLTKFHTERSSSDIEPWKVACSKVEKGAEIARGGWGTISKGTVSVAIKELHGAIAHQSYIDQFRREMQILSQIRHSNLVQFIGAVFDQPSGAPRAIPLIIIELLDTNLRSAYEKGQLRADHKLPIFKDVAKALKYLHERYDPIIHRDVSAPNVLLEALPGGKWKGKLSDLGSANYLKNAQTHAPGAILYAAPETFPTAYNPDAPPVPQTFKLDVYSFGVMLCEVMTDRFPKKEDYGDMLRQVQRTCLPIYNLIRQCTEYKQENRPEMAVVLTTLDTVRYP